MSILSITVSVPPYQTYGLWFNLIVADLPCLKVSVTRGPCTKLKFPLCGVCLSRQEMLLLSQPNVFWPVRGSIYYTTANLQALHTL